MTYTLVGRVRQDTGQGWPVTRVEGYDLVDLADWSESLTEAKESERMMSVRLEGGRERAVQKMIDPLDIVRRRAV